MLRKLTKCGVIRPTYGASRPRFGRAVAASQLLRHIDQLPALHSDLTQASNAAVCRYGLDRIGIEHEMKAVKPVALLRRRNTESFRLHKQDAVSSY